jgi:hypothetical protein
MLMRLIDRLDDALKRDARLDAALRRLPEAAGTGRWVEAQATAQAAVRGALLRVLREAVRGRAPRRPVAAPGGGAASGAMPAQRARFGQERSA